MIIAESKIITWSLLIIGFCIIFALHFWINRKLQKKLEKQYDPNLLNEITNFQRIDTIKLYNVTAILFSVIIAYDQQVRELGKELVDLAEIITINEKIDSEQKAIKEPVSDADIDAETVQDEKDYYPPIMKNSNIAVNDNNAEPEPVVLKPQTTIQDIFGDDHSKKSVNDIKGRYEELLATYLLMDKCGKASKDDYNIIIRSLQKEIAEVNAPVRLQYDTLVAAKGSYDELYSRNDCSKPDLQITETQYKSYIETLSKLLQKS